MATRKTLRDAAQYAGRHLRTINEDVQNEESYSRKMRNDLNLAIDMLDAAPDAYDCLAHLVGFVEAGPMEKYMARTVVKANAALARVYGRRR